MLSYEKMRELADQAHRDYDRLVADGTCPPLWSAVFGHLVAKEAQAATLATVTPLVQKICNSLENLLATVKGECPSLLNEDSGGSAYLGMDADDSITAARAFLSGATIDNSPPL